MKNDASPCGSFDSYHGGIDFAELERHGISPDRVVDFSSNILPYGPSPSVVSAIREVDIERYPDRACYVLRQKIANVESVPASRIIVGNGCSELIHMLAHTLLRPTDQTLVIGPTFSEYGRATRFVSANMHECRAKVEAGFAVPEHEVAVQLAAQPTALAWICNPNNPTGRRLAPETILRWTDSFPETTFVVDESYVDFATPSASLVQEERPNLIVLRSMTKSMAIAGLRLGFAVASERVADLLRERMIPWNVNSLAQAAGVAALDDRDYYATAISRLRDAKGEFLSNLRRSGFHPVPSEVNYFLLPVPGAASVRERLLQHGFLVRDCASFGIRDHLRLAVRTRSENRDLCRLLTKVVSKPSTADVEHPGSATNSFDTRRSPPPG